MIILAVGLLGVAGLQAMALKNNQSAYNRGQATQMAYDMADRIRANLANASLLAASVYVTMSPGDAKDRADCITVSLTCTAADLAENDLFEWNQAIINTLPSTSNDGIRLPANGVITVNAVARIFTITMTWYENREDDNDIYTPDSTSFSIDIQI